MRQTLTIALLALATTTLPASAVGQPYAALISRASQALQVSPDLVHAIIDAESDYRARARSRAGALGLMQLIPEYSALEAYRYLYEGSGVPTDAALLRPRVNIWLGTTYLRILRERYFGWIEDPGLRLLAIIAAYNWGPTRTLNRLFPDRQAEALEQFMRELDRDAPMQTREYVRVVVNTLKQRRGHAEG